MQNKYNHFFNFFPVLGLACFSHLFLVLYSDLSPQHQNVLISFWAFLLVVFVFNVIGFSIILISEWQRKSYQVLMKRNNQLLINCLLMAGLFVFDKLSAVFCRKSIVGDTFAVCVEGEPASG